MSLFSGLSRVEHESSELALTTSAQAEFWPALPVCGVPLTEPDTVKALVSVGHSNHGWDHLVFPKRAPSGCMLAGKWAGGKLVYRLPNTLTVKKIRTSAVQLRFIDEPPLPFMRRDGAIELPDHYNP